MSSTEWLSVNDFARLVGVKRRVASKALRRGGRGLPWNGTNLDVRVVRGRGGASGKVYEVALESLDQALRDAYRAAQPPNVPAARAPADDECEFKLNVIQAVYRLDGTYAGCDEAGGVGRDDAIIQVCAETRHAHGKRRGRAIGVRSVYRWIAAYESEGIAGLMHDTPANAGKDRAAISREWDALVNSYGMSLDQQRGVAERLTRKIKGQWHSSPSISAMKIRFNVRPFLIRFTRDAMPAIPIHELREVCLVPKHVIERHKAHRGVAIWRLDAGRSAATQTPRIRRSRKRLQPMQWLAADVHHFDVLIRRDDGTLCTFEIEIRRDDGTLCTPKAIAWECLATNRLFVTPLLVKKGKMVSRRDVIESFVALCADPDWGAPMGIYGDRGGEYNWLELAEDLLQLRKWCGTNVELRDIADLPEKRRAVRRSLPYNPQSKVIEGAFNALELVLAPIPGHIGGDRFRKKTQNQGKDPIPFPGGFRAFRPALATALDYYHALPQSKDSHLAGESPNERFRAFVERGWQSITLDPHELEIAFATEGTRYVNEGGKIKWGGDIYRHDAIQHLADTHVQVTVRAPLFGDSKGLYVFHGKGRSCLALPEEEYDFDDGRGAGEHNRRGAEFRRQMRAMEAEGDHDDPIETMRLAAEAAGPKPHATSAGTIEIDRGNREAVRQRKVLEAEQPRLAHEEEEDPWDRYIELRAASRGAK